VTDTIGPMPAQIDQQQLAWDLVDRARADGVELIGPGGLLTGLTKTVIETALEAELSEYLGYDKHPGGPQTAGTRAARATSVPAPVLASVTGCMWTGLVRAGNRLGNGTPPRMTGSRTRRSGGVRRCSTGLSWSRTRPSSTPGAVPVG
jgi:hypothetical protein